MTQESLLFLSLLKEGNATKTRLRFGRIASLGGKKTFHTNRCGEASFFVCVQQQPLFRYPSGPFSGEKAAALSQRRGFVKVLDLNARETCDVEGGKQQSQCDLLTDICRQGSVPASLAERDARIGASCCLELLEKIARGEGTIKVLCFL